VFLCLALGSPHAALIYNKGGSTKLNSKKAWTGNRVPGVNDIALWNVNSAAASVTLGGNLSWMGIQITAATGNPLSIATGNTLTLGTSGIDMSSAGINFTLGCAVVLGAAQTWSVNSGRTLAATNVVSGTGGITKTGAGILTLSGTNTFTGAVTISGGTVSVTNGSALGAGNSAVVLGAGAIFQAGGTFSSSRAFVLGGTGGAASGGTFDVTGANIETRTGVISGAGSLIKTGTGTLTLNAVNTYTGDTFINVGTVSIGNTQALGPQPSLGSALYATHMANGTTLQTTVSSTSDNRRLDLISGSATIDVTSGISQQQNGLVSGAGSLIKAGTGTEILTNANTYTGGTTVNAGTLQVNNATGSGTGTGAVTVNSGGTLSGLPTATGFANPGSIAGAVTVNSGGTVLARSGGTFTFGGLTLNASAISTFQIGAATNTAIINVTGLNGLSLAGISTVNIMNAGGLAAGTYHLFDYTGTALAGITNLTLGSTPGGGFTYTLGHNLSNTSIDLVVLASSAQWGNAMGGNWSLTTNWADANVPNGVGAQANFLGAILGPQNVSVSAAYTVGTMTFNNANAYTVAGDGVGSHILTLNNGGTASIDVAAGSHVISAPVALANNLLLTTAAGTGLNISGVITESGGSRTVVLGGAGAVTFSGAAANTYTGLTTVSGGSVNLAKTAGFNAIGTGGLQINAGGTATLAASNQIADTATVTADGTFALGTNSETIAALKGVGNVTLGAGSKLTIGSTNNLNSIFGGVISGAGTITKAGTGTLTLTGANTFGGAGQTIALNAGTLMINGNASLGHTSNTVTFGGGALALAGDVSSARGLILSSNATINTDTNAANFSGTISGAGVLTKTGAGTMTLSGPNTYTGGTVINAGTVVVNSASSLGASTGALTVNAGTLEVATGFVSTRNIALGHADSTVQIDASQTYSTGGVISGSGNLNKTGTGTLTLTKASSFTGATVVDEGKLIAAATTGSALASTTAITVNDGGTLLLGASDQISNSAPISLNGGTIAKGNFNEGTASLVGLGALTLESAGSRLDFGTGTVGILTFASFDPGTSPDFESLLIENWTGTPNHVGSGGTDRLIFNASQTANLAAFSFNGYADGATQFSLGGGFYEVVPVSPVPEPATYAVGLLALLAVTWQQRRRLLHLFASRFPATLPQTVATAGAEERAS